MIDLALVIEISALGVMVYIWAMVAEKVLQTYKCAKGDEDDD